MKKLIIATKNKGKAKEFKSFFRTYDFEVVSLLDMEHSQPDVEETGKTFEENAALKAESIASMYGEYVLADDSGLIIDALDGRPGIYSARYAGEPKDDKRNIAKVLKELENVPMKERTARFICVLALTNLEKETIFKTGYCEGHIGFEERGSNGFGYDPIFIPDGYTKTMAELTPIEKNKISHRRHAMEVMEAWLKGKRNEGFHD